MPSHILHTLRNELSFEPLVLSGDDRVDGSEDVAPPLDAAAVQCCPQRLHQIVEDSVGNHLKILYWKASSFMVFGDFMKKFEEGVDVVQIIDESRHRGHHSSGVRGQPLVVCQRLRLLPLERLEHQLRLRVLLEQSYEDGDAVALGVRRHETPRRLNRHALTSRDARGGVGGVRVGREGQLSRREEPAPERAQHTTHYCCQWRTDSRRLQSLPITSVSSLW